MHPYRYTPDRRQRKPKPTHRAAQLPAPTVVGFAPQSTDLTVILSIGGRTSSGDGTRRQNSAFAEFSGRCGPRRAATSPCRTPRRRRHALPPRPASSGVLLRHRTASAGLQSRNTDRIENGRSTAPPTASRDTISIASTQATWSEPHQRLLSCLTSPDGADTWFRNHPSRGVLTKGASHRVTSRCGQSATQRRC
jgi:hypothetical protein